MGKKALHTFMDIGELRKIGAASLSALLEPHADFFSAHEVELTDDNEAFPFDALADVLQRERESVPPVLVNALYLITEMADASGLDMLIDIARREGLIGGENREELTAPDLAVRLYLHNPTMLENHRDRRVVQRKRTYVYFSAKRPYPRSTFSMSARMRRHFEEACNNKFREHQRGEGAKLKEFPEDDIIRFLVRHGESLKREGVLQGTESASIIYRPEMFDAFHFDPAQGILGMPQGPKWQTELYRINFGLILYNDRDAFKPLPIFTFQPLIEHGSAALACPTVREVASIRLVNLEWHRPGGNGLCVYKDVDDVFSALEEDGHAFPAEGIRLARFVIRIRATGEERYFEIQGAQKVVCQRDTDLELLWPWLEEKNFLIQAEPEDVSNEVDAEMELANALD